MKCLIAVAGLTCLLLAHFACGQPADAPTTRPAGRPVPKSIAEAIERFEIDPRLTLCHVWERPDGSLAGFVEHDAHRKLLGAWLNKDVSAVKLLPEASATQDRFGIVTADHVLLREFPVDRPGDRDNVSDLLLGEPVWILDRHPSGSLLVHSSDGYLGWVDGAAVGVVTRDVFQACMMLGWRIDPEVRFKDPWYERAIRERAWETIVDRAGAEARKRLEGRSAAPVIRSARALLGTPYVWGGKTKAGIDCSGLVQVSFAKHGIFLPRDADQQADVGRLVATRWCADALLPGDLLFFMSPHRGNVHHVAIYLGAGKFIESAGEGVRIRSLTPGDADYDAERAPTFCRARRVIE